MLASLKARVKKIEWRRLAPFMGAGALSAALLVLSFPSYSVWGLAFIGMIPLLVACLRARTWGEVFSAGFACMLCFIWFGFGWISFVATNFGGLPWIVGKIVMLLFSLFAEGQFLIFALTFFALLPSIRKQTSLTRALVLLLAMPMAYVGFDFLYPKIFPSAFGHVLYEWFTVAQLAEYTGVYALSVPIVLVNMALALLINFKREKLVSPLASCAVIILVALGLLAADRWGGRRIAELKQFDRVYSKHLKVSIIQANIGDMDKLASENGFEPAVQRVLGTYREQTIDRVKHEHPDLVIWPETSFPFLYTHFKDDILNRTGQARDVWIYEFLKTINTPLYFGTYTMENRRDFNSAVLLEPPFKLSALYRKSILLAFGEYVPLGPLSPIVESIVPTIANFGRGPGPTVFELKGVKLGPQICYEGIYPEHSRHAVQLGADALLNITNDSWFGNTTEPWLHLALTAFRSIELRRPMIRATNTGISTIIDTTGEMRYRTRLFEPAALDATIHVPGVGQRAPETFYLRHGEVFAQALAAIALGSVAVALSQMLRRRRR